MENSSLKKYKRDHYHKYNPQNFKIVIMENMYLLLLLCSPVLAAILKSLRTPRLRLLSVTPDEYCVIGETKYALVTTCNNNASLTGNKYHPDYEQQPIFYRDVLPFKNGSKIP